MITEKPELERQDNIQSSVIKSVYCKKCKKKLTLREIDFVNSESRCKNCKSKINIS